MDHPPDHTQTMSLSAKRYVFSKKVHQHKGIQDILYIAHRLMPKIDPYSLKLLGMRDSYQPLSCVGTQYEQPQSLWVSRDEWNNSNVVTFQDLLIPSWQKEIASSQACSMRLEYEITTMVAHHLFSNCYKKAGESRSSSYPWHPYPSRVYSHVPGHLCGESRTGTDHTLLLYTYILKSLLRAATLYLNHL